MNKNLLLIFTMTLSVISTKAYSETTTMKYGGNNQFTYKGQTFNGFSKVRLNLDSFIIDPSLYTYKNDLVNNAAVTKDFKTACIQYLQEADMRFSENDLDLKIHKLKNKIATNQVPQNKDPFDLLQELFEKEQDIAAEELKEYISYRNKLKKITNNDEKEKTKNVTRTTQEAQEALKILLQQVKKSKNSSESFKISNSALIDQLKENLDLFIHPDPENAEEKDLPPIQKSDALSSELLTFVNSSNFAHQSVINARTNSFIGLPAGDLVNSYGFWLKGTFANGNQKARKRLAGYKFKTNGITIGADIGDESLLGIAFSTLKSNSKSTSNVLDKNNLNTYIGTLYGKYAITNQVFLSAQTSFGKSEIKKKRDSGDKLKTIIAAKTKATNTSGKLELGYDYILNSQIHFIPTIGVNHTNVKVNGYKEEGTGLVREISKRTTSKTSTSAGIMVMYITNISKNTKLTPEIHFNIDHAINTKNSDTTIKIIEAIDPIKISSEKLAKNYYSFGGSLKLNQSDRFEVSVGYDLGIAKKFISNQGSLKVRVNI